MVLSTQGGKYTRDFDETYIFYSFQIIFIRPKCAQDGYIDARIIES